MHIIDQQPIQNLQPEIQPQKPLSKTWQIVALTIAGVLVVGGVAVGSYYLWQKSDVNKNQTACTMEVKQCADGSYVGRTGSNCELATCPSMSPSASTVIDEPAVWQTYENDRFGFEVKYPNGWRAEGGVARFFIDPGNSMCRITGGSGARGSLSSGWTTEEEEITIDSKKYTQKLRKDEEGILRFIDINNFPMGDGFELDFQDDNCLNTLYQILSTFKFTIDPNTDFSLKNLETVNWQMYKNEKYGFEVKYPKLYVEKSEDRIILLFELNPVFESPEYPLEHIFISAQSDNKNDAQTFASLYKANKGDDVLELHHANDVKVIKLNNLKIGDYDAVEYIEDGITLATNETGRGPMGYSHIILVKKNNQGYIWLINTSMEVSKTKQRDAIFNRIVSSLIFK